MNDTPADSWETGRLLEQARAGDRQAVGQLLARHQDYLDRFVALRLDPRLRPRLDPWDIVQEAYLEALGRLGAYLERPPRPFRLWLRQIALDHTRKPAAGTSGPRGGPSAARCACPSSRRCCWPAARPRASTSTAANWPAGCARRWRGCRRRTARCC
jgi:hypothetical protein